MSRTSTRQMAFLRLTFRRGLGDLVCGRGKAEKVRLEGWLEQEGGRIVKGRVKVLTGFGLLSNSIRKELNGSSQQEQEGGPLAEVGSTDGG